MPPTKFTSTQLHITDIYESDDTLHAAASKAERTTPTVLLEAEIDDDHDDDIYDDLRGQRNKDCPINNDSGNHRSKIPDEDRLDVATPNRLMLEMLLEDEAHWEPQQSLEQ